MSICNRTNIKPDKKIHESKERKETDDTMTPSPALHFDVFPQPILGITAQCRK
jgi:hypothetical protein